MEQKTVYYISEAAKKVQVESHVLRYWEEELKLPIKRNEMGHRYYTEQDVRQLQEIKQLKEQGLQLKAIRTVLFHMPAAAATTADQEKGRAAPEAAEQAKEHTTPDGAMREKSKTAVELAEQTGVQTAPEEIEQKNDIWESEAEMRKNKLMEMVKERVEDKAETLVMNKAHRYMVTFPGDRKEPSEAERECADAEKSQKAARLQYLLRHMITEAVRSANRELCDEVKDSILKELDYQFRRQEERDDERWKQEEEHYRKIDEMIRERHKPREKLVKGRKKV